MRTARGFTLIEVLIALSIIAIALAAVLQVLGHNLRATRLTRDKLVAHWVAQNVLAECQVGLWSFAQTTEHRGTSDWLGQTWSWRARLQRQSETGPLTAPVVIEVTRQGKVWARWQGRC